MLLLKCSVTLKKCFSRCSDGTRCFILCPFPLILLPGTTWYLRPPVRYFIQTDKIPLSPLSFRVSSASSYQPSSQGSCSSAFITFLTLHWTHHHVQGLSCSEKPSAPVWPPQRWRENKDSFPGLLAILSTL